MKKYTETHEWIEAEGNEAIIGITQHAADELGDVVFVDLPVEGKNVVAGDVLTTVESVKAASDVYAPVSCEVTEVNEDLSALPNLINRDAENEGWLVKVKISDESELDSLMSEDDYKAFLLTEH